MKVMKDEFVEIKYIEDKPVKNRYYVVLDSVKESVKDKIGVSKKGKLIKRTKKNKEDIVEIIDNAIMENLIDSPLSYLLGILDDANGFNSLELYHIIKNKIGEALFYDACDELEEELGYPIEKEGEWQDNNLYELN